MPLCKYANALGNPGEGLHKYRVGPFATFDVFLTGALAILASKYLLHSTKILVICLVFICLIALSVGAHTVFCVNTPLTTAVLGRKFEGTRQ